MCYEYEIPEKRSAYVVDNFGDLIPIAMAYFVKAFADNSFGELISATARLTGLPGYADSGYGDLIPVPTR